MELNRDAHLISCCLLLVLGGVLTKPLSSTDFHPSRCPAGWVYIGSDKCAYPIPRAVPDRELQLVCHIQSQSQLQFIRDHPVCIKSTAVTTFLNEDLDTSQGSRDNRLYKRVFGNSGIGR